MTIRPRYLLIGGVFLFAAGCTEPTAPLLDSRGGVSASGLGYGSGHEAGASTESQATTADSTTNGRAGLGYGSGH